MSRKRSLVPISSAEAEKERETVTAVFAIYMELIPTFVVGPLIGGCAHKICIFSAVCPSDKSKGNDEDSIGLLYRSGE